MHEISSRKGNYIIIFRLEERTRQNLHRFDDVDLIPGYYFYCGSAHGNGGLKSRIMRHLTKSSKKFWHIDYLKDLLFPVEIWCQTSSGRNECSFCKIFHKQMGGEIPIKGFGSSDCKNKCESHLVWFSQEVDLDYLFNILNSKFSGMTRIHMHDLL